MSEYGKKKIKKKTTKCIKTNCACNELILYENTEQSIYSPLFIFIFLN